MDADVSTGPFLTGQFLLAMPGIGDDRFDRAVIAMCAHDADGALGIGIGATIEGLTLHDVLDQLDIPTDGVVAAPVHFGGPVEPRRGFVVHSTEWSGQDTVDVAGRWALSGTVDVLRAIAEGTGPRRWLIALGYAGWGEGQLDAEMTRHGWLNVAGDEALLYETDVDDRWPSGFRGAGIDPALLANSAGQA
ncbi:YqgE/AlgH family protein [Sphingomonas sp.]|uniref:YqgE/AlgH family protein n=1 Tax=Sphingomonas sp. TaxID=28214 RepID=UPI002C42F9A0|nr:YqgE/AlgH family protein [Sphingomonas sp.]HTG38825.1 YqgE/AlgH family protein [Sphingomonas sp.]